MAAFQPPLEAHKLPPGPTPLPIIGSFHLLGLKPHKSLAHLAKAHGPIMTLKLGHVTTIIVSSPKLSKSILQTHDHLFSNRLVPDAVTALNHHRHSLTFLPVCPLWRSLRKICNTQLFSPKTLDATRHIRRAKILDLLRDVRASCARGEAVDIGKAAFKTTINLLSNTMFSVDLVESEGEIGDFKESVRRMLDEVGRPNVSDYVKGLRWVDPMGNRRRTGVQFRRLLGVFGGLVSERVRLRGGRGQNAGEEGQNDMLEALLDIAEEDSEVMDAERIQRLSLDLFAAGTDTTTSALEWAMSELLRHPDIMSKAKSELDKTVGKGKPIEESHIASLPYIQAIVKETFRLHPATPILPPRRADTDVALDTYTIPEGAQVLVNVWAINRDPNVWAKPEVFSPERFLELEIDVKGRHFELTPFGGGRRMCPGHPLALRMLYLMLGSLLNCFDWKLEEGGRGNVDMDDKFGTTLTKAKPLLVIPFV
ncbi:geraniol 8-hydroxylase-like [Senna tora]|uniref:Geraniol 8-hydroxylase-like n=1 Tax=Senna tora TaxID=362788 RepID=A0A834TNL3_9FABA|nr:geraniol 8-hydroxylase-like [Senna tora]